MPRISKRNALKALFLASSLVLSINSQAALWVSSNPATFFDVPTSLVLSGSSLFMGGYTLNSGTFVFDGRLEKRDLAGAGLVTAFDGDGIVTQAQALQNVMTIHVIEQGGSLYTVSQIINGLLLNGRLEK